MAFTDQPLIIGHRGAAGLAPENTLPSFQAAYEAGVDAIELDVYQINGKLIVFHDDLLDRTTNGTGELLSQGIRQLRKLDAGDGARIPFLEEVLASVPPGIGINIELKGPDTAEVVAATLADHPDKDILVSSFDLAQLREFRRLRQHAPVAPLFSRWSEEILPIADALAASFVHLNYRYVTQARLTRLAQAGYRVSCYTVNRLATARRLLASGVCGLFTDRPDKISHKTI